jgi:hypothetical protein
MTRSRHPSLSRMHAYKRKSEGGWCHRAQNNKNCIAVACTSGLTSAGVAASMVGRVLARETKVPVSPALASKSGSGDMGERGDIGEEGSPLPAPPALCQSASGEVGHEIGCMSKTRISLASNSLIVECRCRVPPLESKISSISRVGSCTARAMDVRPFLPTGAFGFAPSCKNLLTLRVSPFFTASYSFRSRALSLAAIFRQV